MSISTVQSKSDAIVWQVESFRLTSFPTPAKEFKAENLWQDVIGEPSENTIVRAREGFRQDDGRFNGRKVVLGTQPIRIDWLMGPNEEDGETTIGTFQDSLDLFLELMSRWLKISPPLRRLAFGTILVFPVDSRKAGYEVLGNYLPNVKLDPVGTSDFLYQINRPRISQSQISELMINRLTKWSVLKRGLARFELSPDAQVALFPSSETLSCRLELDINTSGEYQGELAVDKLSNIFNELVGLTKEIALRGDIA